MNNTEKVVDLQSVLNSELYSQARPQVDGVKQVLDALKERVQPLTPQQLQAIGYLNYLQARPLHGKDKPYKEIIEHIETGAPKVAPPGFFIRIIEALVPRPTYIDGKSFAQMAKEKDGN